MKNKKLAALEALLLAGFMAVGLYGKYGKNEESSTIIMPDSTRYFGVGEHIISTPIDYSESSPLVPIQKSFSEVKQYEYHDGYKVVGIASASSGYSFAGACLIYENEYPVECHSTIADENGTYIYTDFGQPMDFYREETNKTSTTKDFNIGEHIISIPIDDPTSEAIQYEYHEGYEVVGIATSNYRYDFAGACVLYVNNQPVTCTVTESTDNQELYLSFGEPLEKGTARTLSQNIL